MARLFQIKEKPEDWSDLERLHAEHIANEVLRKAAIASAQTRTFQLEERVFLESEAPYPLAPVYDMLPMLFRPSGTGEVVEREFEPKLPKPEDQAAWLEMYPLAINYWQKVQQCPETSTDFQKIAEQAITALQHIHKIAI